MFFKPYTRGLSSVDGFEKCMAGLSESELQRIRSLSIDPLVSCYRELLRDSTVSVLNEMVMDSDYPGATDPAALSFIAFLARIRQPQRVLELGTRIGFSTIILADIISKNNGPGRVTTVDPWGPHVVKAKKYAQQAKLMSVITFVGGKSTDDAVIQELKGMGPFDLIYVDSSHFYGETMKELDIYCTDNKLSNSGTLFLFHDAAESASEMDASRAGGVPRALRDWYDETRKGQYQLLVLEPPCWPNPAGLAILTRRTKQA